MKKKTIKKKAPAYAFGIEDALSLANIAGGLTQGLSDEFSKGDVAGQTISGAASGAMTGLSVGGPIGAAIGGVGGLLGGLFGARKRSREAQRRERIKRNQQEIAMGKSNAATAEQLYWEDNALASTFENGGILPDLAYVDNNEIIRDDAGNIMQVPNTKPGTDNHLIDASNLDSVLSDKLKRPGTNKTFAQEGKELVKMTKKSKGNDRFARASDMLNSRHANIKYNQLLDEQEAVKAKKGVKPKVKGIPAYEDGTDRFITWGDIKLGMPNSSRTYPDNLRVRIDARGNVFDSTGASLGRYTDPYLTSNPEIRNPLVVPERTTTPSIPNVSAPNRIQEVSDDELYRIRMNTSSPYTQFYGGTLPEVTATGTNIKKIRQDKAKEIADSMMIDWDPRIPGAIQIAAENDRNRRRASRSNWTEGMIMRNGPSPGRTYTYQNVSNSVDGLTGETIPVDNDTYDAGTLPGVTITARRPRKSGSTSSGSASSTSSTSSTNPDFNDYSLWNTAPVLDAVTRLPNVDDIKITPKDLSNPRDPKTPKNGDKPSFDFSGLAGLEPILYNFVRSLQDPEVEDPVLNPYAGAINRAMARRRLNIEPTLAANRRSRAINRQNMARLNPNTGMNLAYGNQLATAEYAQNASTYADRDNANNQYLGEYADMMNNLGQQYVQNTVLTNDLNARNRAAARNFGSTAAGQLGQWSQNRVQMRNQARRDAQLLPYLEDYLNAVTNVAKSNKLIV